MNRDIETIENNLERLDGCLAYKTTSHEIVHCNQNFLRAAGYPNIKKIAGKTDCDLIWQEYSNIYHQQEQDALNGNFYSALYPGKNAVGKDVLYLSKKSLWTNEERTTIGIISYGLEIQSVPLTELGLFLKKTSKDNPNHGYHIGKQYLAHPLSQRERECLFYIIRGKTAKNIAKILGLSYYTIETYIARLKEKFHCHTRSELIDAAIQAGLFNMLPETIPAEKLLSSLKN